MSIKRRYISLAIVNNYYELLVCVVSGFRSVQQQQYIFLLKLGMMHGGSELIMSWEVNLQYRILLFMMMVILTFDCTNAHCWKMLSRTLEGYKQRPILYTFRFCINIAFIYILFHM